MAFGNLAGEMHDPMDFVNPQKGPIAVLFMMSIVWVWIAFFYWLLAKGGAEELAESGHISFIGVPVSDPKLIKFFFLLSVVGGACALVWYLIQPH